MNEYTKLPEPLYEKITIYNVTNLIKILSDKKDLMVLSSSKLMNGYGKYTYICSDSFASFKAKNGVFFWNNVKIDIKDPFQFINEKHNTYKIKKNDTIPPLQGGIVGYFGYEANHYLEELPYITDNILLPDIYLNFYSTIIVIDHDSQQSWIISTGFPEKEENNRLALAKKNIEHVKQNINKSNLYQECSAYPKKITKSITSTFTPDSYASAVLKTKEYILNGDIFEANISQQFSAELLEGTHPLELYFKLIDLNSAPFSAYITISDDEYIVSASPERFIKIENQFVETCPIKGTRQRSSDIHEDQRLAEELKSSKKDHAENVMIVDLMRNDLSKVCQLGSIQVDELCELKSFETVHHLVSKITGKLKTGMNSIDLLKATFPPGSVTGAPKIRAMEIISELENQTRGPYCGCIGYLSFTGDMDTSVTIRTYFINGKKVFFSAGGAIILDSDPKEEYLESMTKARALINALGISA